MRKTISSKISDLATIRKNLIMVARNYNYFMLLDSNTDYYKNNLPHDYLNFQLLAGIGTITLFKTNINCLSQLNDYIQKTHDWIFLHLTYDLKEEIFNIPTQNTNYVNFDVCVCYQPEFVVQVKNYELTLFYPDKLSSGIAKQFLNQLLKPIKSNLFTNISELQIQFNSIEKNIYSKKVKELQNYMQRGDIYEVNFCFNNIANASINPYYYFLQMMHITPTPFSAFYKNEDKYLLCASPERYLKKRGNHLISQPIKGTILRGKNSKEDELNKKQLQNSLKERSENIMIVDLVRNDLSMVSKPGTVSATEICGIYAMPNVFQMISTIEGTLNHNLSFKDILKASFPMGSMTGAPKKNAIRFIEQTENFARNLFSGSVGYIDPERNFDLNVVIRSILYNNSEKIITIPVGSGITIYANPEQEYAECMTKVKAILKLF